jgi:PAS domain S-box-containing protein
MRSAATPSTEARRLAVLRELGLLDSEPEACFDALVDAAARLTDSPISVLSLVDERRQWFKAQRGLALRETSRETAICAHTILGDSLLEVPDTLRDERFAANPMVLGEPHIRFYAGEPIRFRGETLGTLAIMDTRVRALTPEQRSTLHGLAQVATELLRSRQRMNALNDEHRRLLDFSRASGDWLWETDENLNYRWVSGALEAVTGMTPESLIGQAINEDLPLLDAYGMPQPQGKRFGDLLQQRQAFSRAVVEKQTPRGLLYVSRSAVPVFDEGGVFKGWRGTARDLSAQVEAMRRSRNQDVLLRKLTSQVPGVIFQLQMDAAGRFSYPYASEGMREIFRAEPPPDGSGADSELPFRLLHPDDREAFFASLHSSARTLARWQHEFRVVHDDATVCWLETRAMPERVADGATLWHGFTANVTDRKEIELALRRSEERWEMAADAAGIGIAELDVASGRLSFDQRACINHGLDWPQPHFTLDDWLQTIHADDRDAARAGLQHALATHDALETRYRVVRPDGSTLTLEIMARGHYDAQGAPLSMVGACRDVTAQLSGERLKRDMEASERANRAKSEFLSRVSHELRTPLNGILGFAQLMAMDRVNALAPDQARRLDSVLRSGHHLLALINNVLDLSRLDGGDFALAPATIDAWATLQQSLALVLPLANELGIHLPTLSLAQHEPCWVRADPAALEQALMNLLSNAIKYNRRGGGVEVAARSDGRCVQISIRDEGRGISAEQQASLFQPFNRLADEQRRTQGSGLGLVIARRLAEAMDGELRLQSHAGDGCTFTLALPAGTPGDSAAAAPSTEPAAAHATDTEPREVLYIEDEPLNAVLMEEVFRTQPQWHLLLAEDGASGVRIARESQPDLVLIDMNLPDMNGLTLIRRLRADPLTRRLCCIALSADAMREQIEAAMAAGFDDYWTKPIDVHRVLGDLMRLLAQHAQPK